jgi:hypothetical protein
MSSLLTIAIIDYTVHFLLVGRTKGATNKYKIVLKQNNCLLFHLYSLEVQCLPIIISIFISTVLERERISHLFDTILDMYTGDFLGSCNS